MCACVCVPVPVPAPVAPYGRQYAELRETVYPEAVVKVMQLCGLAADTALKWIKQVRQAELARRR